jgi:uncharacterized pyridoxamine 5'-phosphate oxidase family protein
LQFCVYNFVVLRKEIKENNSIQIKEKLLEENPGWNSFSEEDENYSLSTEFL